MATTENLFNTLSGAVSKLDDNALIAAARQAKADKPNPYVVAALIAEATYRGIAARLDS